MMSTRMLANSAAVAALMCAMAVPAFAQETTSAVRGRITDGAGAAVAGATVSITHVPTGTTVTTLSGPDGYYPRLAGKPAGYLYNQLVNLQQGRRNYPLMQNLLAPNDLKLANRFRRLWSLYQQNVDLIQVGAYQPGTNAEIDQAIAARPAMENFLRQEMYQGVDESQTRTDVRVLMEL